MSKISDPIDNYLKEKLNDYIDELSQLCAQPSVASNREDIEKCADIVIKMLEKRDIKTQKIETPGSPVVLGHIKGKSERTLLFYNHYDVQPAEPLELWTSPPYEPTIRDNNLYARGACDDKGEIIARLAALDAIRQANNGELPCNITFIIEGEEEAGSPHIADFVEKHVEALQCDGIMWEGGGTDQEGQPSMVLGTRGILFVEFSVETMSMDAHSGEAHILPNAAWRLIRALECLKGIDERIQIAGFYDDALPPDKIDLELINSLPDYEENIRKEFGVKNFVLDRKGKELDKAIFEPTCNIAGFTAGFQGEGMKTVIPATASAKVDFRLVPNQNPHDIFEKLVAHLKEKGFEDVTVKKLGAMWPAKTPADNPLIQLTAQKAEEVYGKPCLLSPMVGGSGPAYFFIGPLGGVPVTFAGVGNSNNRMHAPDEYVNLTDFLNGTRHIARIINEFADLS